MSLTTANYSYYAVPAMWGISIVNHWIAIGLFNNNRKKGSKPFQVVEPKLEFSEERCRSVGIGPELAAKIRRAEAANNNGFENIGLFGTAVLAGNVAGLPNGTLNGLTATYLLSRIAYSYLYINISTDSLSKLRSLAYLSGVGICFTLFIKAGNAMGRGVLLK